MFSKLPFLSGILIASLLNNLLIPFAIYYQKYGFFKKRNKDFIGCNTWGIIMDGILAGLINIIAFNLLLAIRPRLELKDLIAAFVLGFSFMVAAHVWMSVNRWKIWIMPRPWHWNIAGFWHMISMTLQMSFLFYPLILILENPLLWEKTLVKISLIAIAFFALLFGLSLQLMKKGVRIGKLRISNKPW